MTTEARESGRGVSGADAVVRPPPPLKVDNGLGESASDVAPLFVVLDEDPSEIQTCHDVNVLTAWDEETLLEEFRSDCRGFFILTDSRALAPGEARDLIRAICRSLQRAAELASKKFEVVFRGKLALYSHFSLEIEASEEVLGPADIWILAPSLEQMGRLTIDDNCCVASPDRDLTPAAQTPFAKDDTLGYTRSKFREYICEKSEGRIAAERIHPITQEDIRAGGPAQITAKLMSCRRRSMFIVDAIAPSDMDAFVQGLLSVASRGRKFVYCTGTTFVSSRLGMEQMPLLFPIQLGMEFSLSAPGGLIIACSYPPTVAAQLESLVDGRAGELEIITLDVSEFLNSPGTRHQAIFDAANRAGDYIIKGRDVLVITSPPKGRDTEKLPGQRIGSVVAEVLVTFLRFLVPKPRYVVTQGGTTSLPATAKGLQFRRAKICGLAASGVPLWRCAEATSKWPEIPCAVLPSDVGERNALRDLVAGWSVPDVSPPSENRPRMEYQRLGTSGLKVSRVILGCMAYGNPDWEGSPWVLPEQDALPLLKKAYDVGINTWETANTYSNGQSEIIIGKALEKYKIPRSKVVIMTKIYYPVLEDDPNARPQPAANDGALVNQMGLSRKHIFEAVEQSLRRLNTAYVDVLQLHRLDTEARPEEIMCALHDLVRMGKVHYLGASSMRCWQFARLQYTAKSRGWTTFTSMSGLYNLLYREEEREMNPFCEAEGVGLIPWSPNARGLLARPWAKQTSRGQRDEKSKKWFRGRGGQNQEIVQKVERIARARGCTMSSVALAWLLEKRACPIVGLDSEERIEAVSQALRVRLTRQEVASLEDPYQPLHVEAI